MTIKVKDLTNFIERLAPLNSQEDWDNSGLQVGDKEAEVKGVLMAMDLTDQAASQALLTGKNLIICHHPFFFQGLKSIDFSTYRGSLIKKLIDNSISVYAAHTNLDKAVGGVNHSLANIFPLKKLENISDYYEGEIGSLGEIEEVSFADFKKILDENFKDYRILGRKNESIKKIAFIGGSGAFGIKMAKELACDALVTADIKHHDSQLAYELGLSLVDLGHFQSEFPALINLKELLQEEFTDLDIDVFTDPVFF
ncbi:MAG: Nif3-like dinuclear metal center hexameric protein [Bacillota bacterium]|nr:Nif3-like dinuclear metal center hexameric protein [Bacillota bacterium]